MKIQDLFKRVKSPIPRNVIEEILWKHMKEFYDYYIYEYHSRPENSFGILTDRDLFLKYFLKSRHSEAFNKWMKKENIDLKPHKLKDLMRKVWQTLYSELVVPGRDL